MLIASLLATTLTLSLAPDTHRQLEDEAYRLARVLEQAVSEAEMGDALGLQWRRDGYAFFRREGTEGRWQLVNDTLFVEHRWPEGIHAKVLEAPKQAGPWVLWQDNQNIRLTLSLSTAERTLKLALSPIGRVELTDSEDR